MRASALIILVGSALLAAKPTALPRRSAFDPNLAAAIDAYLANTPLKNTGGVFVAEGRRYNVDPRLVVAIAAAESSLGTDWVNCPPDGLNAWSYFWVAGEGCANSGFKSFAEGIHYVTADIAYKY